MHVAILGHTAALSGGELALVRLLPHLLAPDLKVTVLLAESGPAVEAVRSSGADVVVLPLPEEVRTRSREQTRSLRGNLAVLPSTARYVNTLRRWLRQNAVDVVHTNTLKAAIYGGLAGRASELPVLWHIRDRIADDYLPAATVRVVRTLSRVLPHGIAVNSAATAATLPPQVQARVRLVPDCVDPPAVAPPRSRSGDGTVTIGMMGRLSPWKGQDVALEAFARVFAIDRRARLVFVGSPMFGEDAYLERLRARTVELGLNDCVVFRGFRPYVWSEYASFDVAVHASVVPEPFGQVVIEAMAAGVPVVASNAGGPSEVIQNGQDGLLVEPGDVPGLAAALARLLGDPELRHRLAQTARDTAARYSPAATVAALRDAYAAVATGFLTRGAR